VFEHVTGDAGAGLLSEYEEDFTTYVTVANGESLPVVGMGSATFRRTDGTHDSSGRFACPRIGQEHYLWSCNQPFEYVLVLKDDFSGFVELIPATAADHFVAADALLQWHSTFSMPLLCM
jgi:hypothetical protein